MSSRGPQYAQLGSNFVDRDREARKARIDRISTKIHAFFWVLSAVLTFYYMDVWNVMLHDSRVNRFWFNLGVASFGLSFGIMLYLTVYLRYIKNVWIEWEVYCPRVVQAGAFSGLAAALGLIIGFWPVYGFLTFGVLGVLFFGAIMLPHFIPVW